MYKNLLNKLNLKLQSPTISKYMANFKGMKTAIPFAGASKDNSCCMGQRIWMKLDEQKLSGTFVHNWYVPLQQSDEKKDLVDRHRQRAFNINRLLDEPVSICLDRLQSTVSKHISISRKRKTKYKPAVTNHSDFISQAEAMFGPPETKVKLCSSLNPALQVNSLVKEEVITIRLYDAEGAEVDSTLKNGDAWVQNGSLRINDDIYNIEINSPSILSLKLPLSLLSGYFIEPTVELDNGTLADCEMTWFKVLVDGSTIEVAKGLSYTPSLDDVGHHVKLVVIPKDGQRCGIPEEVTSETAITEGPSLQWLADRLALTTRCSHPGR